MTFSDPDREPGSQILGMVLIDARDYDHAVARCLLLGCHPGGIARGTPLAHQPEGVKNRLMTPEEAARTLLAGGRVH